MPKRKGRLSLRCVCLLAFHAFPLPTLHAVNQAISSVSGGGYVASSYVSWLMAAAAKPEASKPRELSDSMLGAFLNNMRRRSSYVVQWGCCTLRCCARDVIPLSLYSFVTLLVAGSVPESHAQRRSKH
jgi:hypothetical protein